MGEIIDKNKDSIIRWANIILVVLFYWFGVVKSNEKTRIEVIHLQTQISTMDTKMSRLDDVKADKEILNMLMSSILRIENKLDKMQERR